MPQQRLDHSVPQRARDEPVAGEDLLSTVALVAAEDLVSAVAREEQADPGVPGHAGTEIRRNIRVVSERLIVGRHQVRDDREGLVGAHEPRIVGGAEVTGRQLRVLELVVALLPETDGEGLDPLSGEASHHPHHRAAVGAPAQEGPDMLDLNSEKGPPNRFLRLTPHLGRSGIPVANALLVAHLPVRSDKNLAVSPHEHVPGRKASHRTIRSPWGGHRAEIQVCVDRVGLHLGGGPVERERPTDARTERHARRTDRVVQALQAESVGDQH